MGFVEMYLPMTAAFVTASVIIESIHFVLGMWLRKRGEAKMKEYYQTMADTLGVSADVLMSQMGDGMMGGMPPMMDFMNTHPGAAPTVSGNEENSVHGQYL